MKKLLMVVAVATALVGVTPVYAEESATQSSAVFEKFNGMEQMASLTEQDKALTGAGGNKLKYVVIVWEKSKLPSSEQIKTTLQNVGKEVVKTLAVDGAIDYASNKINKKIDTYKTYYDIGRFLITPTPVYR